MSSPPAVRAPGRLRWWREVLYILAFYSVYTFIRNRGVATDSVARARRNAFDVIHLERNLGAFWEENLQDAFLGWRAFIQFWNIFYGTAHFVVTVFALVYLFRRMAHRYPLWRNTLACTTGLALIGFAFYPLMPPRLLDPAFGFVDTLKEIGGLWSFDSGAVARVSNQYAAMPSLHFAWSTWCALVLMPAARRPWVRLVIASYPALTLFAIVVTANHYWLDAAGGAATLGAGFVLGRRLTRALEARGRQPLPETVDAGAEPVEVGAGPVEAEPAHAEAVDPGPVAHAEPVDAETEAVDSGPVDEEPAPVGAAAAAADPAPAGAATGSPPTPATAPESAAPPATAAETAVAEAADPGAAPRPRRLGRRRRRSRLRRRRASGRPAGAPPPGERAPGAGRAGDAAIVAIGSNGTAAPAAERVAEG